MRLAALEVLTSADTTAATAIREPEIDSVRRAALAKLRDTPAGRLRFIGLPTRSESQAVDEDEIAAIDASVAVDDPPEFPSHYAELWRILDKLDSAMAPTIAHNAAVRLQIPPIAILAIVDRAARGNLSDRARARLAAALIRLSERQAREGLIITDMMAGVSLGQASELRKDPSLRARAEAVRPEADALQNAARCFYALLVLPLRSMQRAWAEQMTHERAFLQQVARRGLSCPEREPQVKGSADPGRGEQ